MSHEQADNHSAVVSSSERQVGETEPPYGATAMRLSLRQWAAVVLLAVPVMVLAPVLWQRGEPLPATPDYRIPYAYSEDYWLYSRVVARSAADKQIAVIGDSVVWGEYVTPQDTLTAHLNRQAAAQQLPNAKFANLGLNGAHPLALTGLVRHYATSLTGVPVIVHCNLLWMSSPERDLSASKEQSFNHPRLVPQLLPHIPSYSASISDRMGNVVDRNVPYLGWARHLRFEYWDGQNLPDWTLEHPYANPFALGDEPRLDDSQELRRPPVAWFDQGLVPQDLPWMDLDTSLQWSAFRDTVERLQSRGNRVFVVVGPLNEHMLMPGSRQRYQALRRQVEQWLSNRRIPFTSPPPLPSDEYADASHPLSAGYARLASELLADAAFQRWLQGGELPRSLATLEAERVGTSEK